MCSKEKFDLKSAKTVINHAKNQHKKWRREVRYYFCDYCNCYHVTSKEEYEPPVKLNLEELKYAEKWKTLLEN